MQLTRFTDLGLRVLMYLCHAERPEVITIAEVTERFDVSHNHLTKVVQFMGQQRWLVNVRGKGGGMRLAQPPENYRLGQLVRALERSSDLIDCAAPPCALRGQCTLKGLLSKAEEAFYAELDQYTLADALKGKTQAAIVKLHRSSPYRL
jgi:Rrf2 family transcriptional regulator, nitric oxide-sensitive transcriptional repressor